MRRVAGNRKLYVKLLRRFVIENEDTVERISKEIASGNLPTAERTAHTLKGTAGNLGSHGVQVSAGNLEKAIREGADAARVDELRQTLSYELSSLLSRIAAGLGEEAIAASLPGEPEDPQQVQRVVVQMLNQLWVCDAATVETLEAHRGALKSVFRRGGFESFEKQVRDYAFGTAQTLLEEANKAGEKVP